MTRALLIGLSELRSPWPLPASLLVLALLPFAFVVDAIASLRRAALEQDVGSRRSYRCPRGHVVPADGAIRCPSCALTSEVASIFLGCPHCAIVPDAVQCACGASVRNPLAEDLA